MKTALTALALLTLCLPAAAQGNPAPGGGVAAPVSPAAPLQPASARAQPALNACPGLMRRTESAVANGHTQYYFLADCECVARSIDIATWNDATVSYDGPAMPDSDAGIIVGALSSAPTIEDAFTSIDENISDGGYSSVAICYGK